MTVIAQQSTLQRTATENANGMENCCLAISQQERTPNSVSRKIDWNPVNLQ